MDTTTRTISIDLQDQPQAPVDTSAHPTVSATERPEPTVVQTSTKRQLPAWAWLVLALLVAVIVAVAATALHALTTSSAARSTPAAASRSVASGQVPVRSDVAHGTAGHLVDGTGAPVTITGSTAVAHRPGLRLHLPGSHVISGHTLGWFSGRASM